MPSYSLVISHFVCVSSHPNHNVSIVGLNIYHGHLLCICFLKDVCFLGELPFFVVIHFPESLSHFLSCFVNLFSFSAVAAILLLKVHFLDPLSLAASCLSHHFLFYLVHFLTVLAMFDFFWPWYHSCFQEFVPLFCLP